MVAFWDGVACQRDSGSYWEKLSGFSSSSRREAYHQAMAEIPASNMITLTPGTTSLHVSEDRSTLYVHVMNVSDDSVRQIKDGFERSVKEVLP